MQSKQENSSSPLNAEAAPLFLYEYSLVQFTPSVERGEVINVGLLMMCKRRRWVRARIHINEQLVHIIAPQWDVEMLREQLESFCLVADGTGDSPLASIEAHERFRWLTAVRSACITTSRPHPGRCSDLEITFNRLFAKLVMRNQY